ncbi:stage V sporulation protein D, partial [Halomonas sp. MG34]|nr:stage V sporulation protein D [Halomonas sp. MG34]
MKRVSTVTVKKRIVTVFLFGLLIFSIIDIRLGYVQFIIGDKLVGQANDLWTRDIVFEPERGQILDTDGEVLADNVTAPSIVAVPRQISDTE